MIQNCRLAFQSSARNDHLVLHSSQVTSDSDLASKMVSDLVFGQQQSYARQVMSEIRRRHYLLLLFDPRLLVLDVVVELPHLARLLQPRLSLVGKPQQLLVGSSHVQDAITHQLWTARLVSCTHTHNHFIINPFLSYCLHGLLFCS